MPFSVKQAAVASVVFADVQTMLLDNLGSRMGMIIPFITMQKKLSPSVPSCVLALGPQIELGETQTHRGSPVTGNSIP